MGNLTKGAVKFVDMTAKGLRKVAVNNITVKGSDAALYKAKDEKPEVIQALGVEMEIICDDGYRVLDNHLGRFSTHF